MDGYHKSAHAVYRVTYHIVFVTKYRRPCIDDEIGGCISQAVGRILESNKGCLVAAEHGCDHMHFLAELPLDQPAAKFIGVLKSVSARIVRRDYQEKLQPYLWGDSFWSDSYFVTTAGGATIDVVKKYVESQPTKKRKRGNPNWHSSPTDA